MRFPVLALLALPLASCVPAKPLETASAFSVSAPSSTTTPIASPPLVPSSLVTSPQATSQEIAGITFEGVSFDSRSHRLIVVDQGNGPGTQFADAAAAASARGGLAAVNAGFFTPEGTPLGLVASSGKITGSWNSASSLGSGVWFESPSGGTAISRREKLGRTGASTMRELLQAGPLLVENRKAVTGLENSKSSVRMMIAWDGGTRWWIGRGSSCTLAALGQALATNQPTGWPIRQALNLDGGRSSDLWISDSVSGGPVIQRPPWNRPVRNFLVLVNKAAM